ncbi:sugar O-acetyltransferase [Corynebacterium lactis]|uniref:Maltose O-acetyltransferase n=1 Tax=Corynebacterium lactis RW2-5 TaxID=1408189 RepID=A0A0K2H0R8_9CORY|nr:sugar O-acetyltransferase [Corynebacterium lactis]ALA67629.1 maltose O-acetyltransferase [Corynebacterium lactis RW2-5]
MSDNTRAIEELEASRRASLRNTDRNSNPPLTLPDDGKDNRQRMLDGDWYIADHPESKAINQRIGTVAAEFERAFHEDQEAAQKVLAEALGSFGEGSTIRPPIYLDYGDNFHVGADVFVNFGLTVLDVVKVTLGDSVQIGPNVQLLPPVHPLPAKARAAYLESGDEIEIGDNVWIGGGAIILGGVRIGANSVVAAGAVVTKDVPESVVVAGNPAKIIRLIDQNV